MVLASTVLKWIPGSQDREDEIIKIYREHKTKRLSRGGTSTQLGDVDMHHKPSILTLTHIWLPWVHLPLPIACKSGGPRDSVPMELKGLTQHQKKRS